MDIIETAIPAVKIITPRRIGDDRGFFSEVFSAREFATADSSASFVQDNHSWSAKSGTIRGLHFQTPPFAQGKLVRVSRGRILDVAVDIRRSSSTFGQHVAVELSAENWAQLWIPPGFAHGFSTLEDNCEVLYKVTAFYAKDCDYGLAFDDPALGIDWKIGGGSPILSAKDKKHPPLAGLPALFD
jgi:dTDP-4-dehydrorhamnose 3,5-epimerase